MNQQQVCARSAIEALRSGVPSRHAVEQLGTTQAEIKAAFETRLQAMANGEGVEPLVIGAGFGQGKSHLLNYLKTLAANEDCVTSFVVISPEMPIGNPHVVLKAIAESAEAPGRIGRALRSLASTLDTNSANFEDLCIWAREARLDDRFAAMLLIYEQLRSDEEIRTQILGDLEGSPINLAVLRQQLKELGQAAGYSLKSSRIGLLAHDRIRLLARFYQACGAKGWVVLFDELERFTFFPTKQRLAVYDEIGWWTSAARESGSAILPVFAGVPEALTGIIEQDEPRYFPNIATNQYDHEDTRAAAVETLRKAIRLTPPNAEQEDQIKYRVTAIYEQAYGVKAQPLERESFRANTLRSEIRRWITIWDLHRCYADYSPAVVSEEVVHDTTEISDDSIMAGDDQDDGA